MTKANLILVVFSLMFSTAILKHCRPSSRNDELIVQTDQGLLLGTTGTNYDGEVIYKFLGIPYAKPPVGNLRFELPQPGDSWSGIRNASKAGETCRSIDNFSVNIIGTEDCLYLNVYTKKLPKRYNNKLRPVMVYIYGGGLTLGSSRPEVLGPDFLLLKDVVLVTFNYRLGVLGFLSSNDQSLNLPGNLGLKDQLLVLKWIQRNIKKFNGDPDNVTIFGNSAGASSAHTHILSPASRGLFHKAILQSGTALTSDFWGTKDNAVEVVRKAGQNTNSQRQALEVLRKLSVEDIYDAQQKVTDSPFPADVRPFCAVQEYSNPSAILSANPVQTIESGVYNKVPIMMGYTDTEGMLYDLAEGAATRIGVNLTDEDLQLIIPFNMNVSPGSTASKEIVAALKNLYKGQPFEDRYNPMTDSALLVSSIQALRLHLKNLNQPLYLYRMSLNAGLNQLKLILNRLNDTGAAHTDELGYLFYSSITPTIKKGSLEDVSVRRFVELWTNFATFGNPTPSGSSLVQWEPVAREDNIRVLDIGEKLVMKDIPEQSRLTVWWDLLKKWPSKMAEEASVTTVEKGQLKGLIGYNLDGEKFFKFLGIPYAKPPINELRFQPPLPDEPWKGVKDATKEAESSISRDDFTRKLVGSEDCLYLNVYTKSLPTSNSILKPVMVFIHGGGFTVGSSRPGIYGPEFLLLKDIVLVTINYRLGALGFLSLSDPNLKVYGNMGLKDQNLALKWVQKNIKSFNGDPDNVTIFGNSAGGGSVHAHILSPASKGLFHKAILQSGCVFNPFFWGSKDNAVQLTKKAATSQKEALEILKAIPAKEIFAAQEKIYDSPYPADNRPFSAVLENHNPTEILSKNPVEVMESGNYNHVPIMIGYTDNEGMLLEFDKIAAQQQGSTLPELELNRIIPVNLDVTDSNDRKAIARILSEIYSEETLKHKNDPMTDGYFLVGILKTAQLLQKTTTAPIYLYRMSLSTKLNQLKKRLNKTAEPGAGHTDELGYLFHSELTPSITPESLEDRSLRLFVELWTNFASYGNPTPEDKCWTPLGRLDRLPVFDIGSTLEMKEDIPERGRMDVWWKILNRWPLKKFF